MVAQNTAETDEQIIDLTELIEKGEVPANDPSVQSRLNAAAEAEAEKEELQEHLRDLNDGTTGADAEIDDLLAQMDIKVDGQEDPADVALDFSAPSTMTDHHIDPNEQLNMPGMGDVDNLLNSLDIPPQPSEREAEVATPETPDQAVDALLNDFNAPTAPAGPAAPAADHDVPDLDELLASASAVPQSDTSSQIDDLLNETHPAAAPQAAFSHDDIDSLLEAAASGQGAGPSPIQTAAPAPQPVSAPQPAQNTSMDIDIDSLLAAAANDLQHNLDAAEPQAAPAETDPFAAAQQAVAETAPAVSNDDLDSLLAAATAGLEAAPSPAPAQQAAPVQQDAQPTPDMDVAPQPEPVPESEPEPVAEPVAAPLLEPEPQAEPQPEIMELLPEEPAPQTGADSETDTGGDSEADTAAETTADIEAMMAAASGEALAADGSAEQDIPADSADDLLAALSADLSEQPVADITPQPDTDEPLLTENELPALEPVAVEPGTELAAEPVTEFWADPAMAAALVQDQLSQNQFEPDQLAQDQVTQDLLTQGHLSDMPEVETSPAVLAAQQQDDADPAGVESQAALDATLAAVSAEALDAVMAQANEASSHALDAFAQAFDASTRAADAAEAVGTLATRVEHCERALQEAGERIIALETALESQIAASQNLAATALPRQELEGMFMEGHPLYQGLMECISKAVAETLAAAPAPAPAPAVIEQPDMAQVQALIDERLQPVIAAARSAAARIDALEARLDALEPRFNDRVEKAAAAAAARILREEISRLLEE